MKRNLKDIIKATALCIKYPFLYPRNRFTDKHYNNWKIIEFHRKWWKHTSDCFFIKFVTETEAKDLKLACYKKIEERYYLFTCVDNNLIIKDYNYPNKVLFSKPFSEFGTGTIIKCGWQHDYNVPIVIVSDDFQRNPNSNGFVEIVHAKWLRNLILLLDWINNYPLQWIHCLTDHTELDAMPYGWRVAFGLQMCEEIKQELLKTKGHIFKYRITQIGEKYGGLQWYDHNTTKEILSIISKYEKLSYKTCISCGKPATKISKGWISPYCDNCIGDSDYILIENMNEYYESSSD